MRATIHVFVIDVSYHYCMLCTGAMIQRGKYDDYLFSQPFCSIILCYSQSVHCNWDQSKLYRLQCVLIKQSKFF